MKAHQRKAKARNADSNPGLTPEQRIRETLDSEGGIPLTLGSRLVPRVREGGRFRTKKDTVAFFRNMKMAFDDEGSQLRTRVQHQLSVGASIPSIRNRAEDLVRDKDSVQLSDVYLNVLEVLTNRLHLACKRIREHEKRHGWLQILCLSAAVQAAHSGLSVESKTRAKKSSHPEQPITLKVQRAKKFVFQLVPAHGVAPWSLYQHQQKRFDELFGESPTTTILKNKEVRSLLHWVPAYYMGFRFSAAVKTALAKILKAVRTLNEYEPDGRANEKAGASVRRQLTDCLNLLTAASVLRISRLR